MKVTADGSVGWGEVLPAAGNTREPYVAMIERFAENLRGEDEQEDPEALEPDAQVELYRRLRHNHRSDFWHRHRALGSARKEI